MNLHKAIVGLIKIHIRRASKYVVVGTIGFFVDAAVLFVLTQYGHMWYILSEFFATIVAFVNNYFLNYYWTFYDVLKKSILNNAKKVKAS